MEYGLFNARGKLSLFFILFRGLLFFLFLYIYIIVICWNIDLWDKKVLQFWINYFCFSFKINSIFPVAIYLPFPTLGGHLFNMHSLEHTHTHTHQTEPDIS